MAIYGYARVSTQEQNLDRQLVRLEAEGCDRIYTEKLSGVSTSKRIELKNMLDNIEEGDTVIVCDLSRISRSLSDLLKLVDTIRVKGASFKSLKESWIDTTNENPQSKLIMNIMASIYEFEREMLLERQKEGITEAKKRGVYKGRPTKYTEKNEKINLALELFQNRASNGYTVKRISEATGIGEATIYRKAKERELT
jgi:DNA invertase Pin-like site-specific DNA recombinase